MFESIVNFFAVGLLLAFCLYHFKQNKKRVTGPNVVTLLTRFFKLKRKPFETLKEFSKEYGPIFSVNICGQKLVFVNDHVWLKEMLSLPVFCGKPDHAIFTALTKGTYGVISSSGEAWEAHRRFIIRGLRQFGFDKSAMEDLVLQEVSEVIETFTENVGKAFNVKEEFSLSVSNSLWTLVSGKRNNRGDLKILKLTDDVMASFGPVVKRGLFFAPWLRHFFPQMTRYNDFIEKVDLFLEYMDELFHRHKETYIQNSPRDLIDLYMDEIKNAKPGSPFYKEVGERHMKATMADLFIAGNETTGTTLTWAMLYLSHHPQVRAKLHAEIEQVLQGKTPSSKDRQRMPYTDAVILEILRKSSILPIGVPHSVLHDKEFKGFLIEKDTLIIQHLNYILNNPDVWGDPQNFRPERFLSEDGTRVLKNEALMPFLVGKRQCLGESLARDTMFLFISSIFQKFDVLPDPANPIADYEPVFAIISSPKPFKVLVKQV